MPKMFLDLGRLDLDLFFEMGKARV